MKKEFTSFEIATKANHLGFNEDCFAAYYILKGKDNIPFLEIGIHFCSNNNPKPNHPTKILLAPLYQQVERWLRDSYKIFIDIVKQHNDNGEVIFMPYIVSDNFDEDETDETWYKTYEEALQNAIGESLELIENKLNSTTTQAMVDINSIDKTIANGIINDIKKLVK